MAVVTDIRQTHTAYVTAGGARLWYDPTRGELPYTARPFMSLPMPEQGDWYELLTNQWDLGDIIPDIGVVGKTIAKASLHYIGFKPFSSPLSRSRWRWQW